MEMETDVEESSAEILRGKKYISVPQSICRRMVEHGKEGAECADCDRRAGDEVLSQVSGLLYMYSSKVPPGYMYCPRR